MNKQIDDNTSGREPRVNGASEDLMSHDSEPGKAPLEVLARFPNAKIFPCKPDKRPYTTHGFQDASADREKIRLWWEKWPNALIGLPTGDGLAVIDTDQKNGKDGATALGRLEEQHGKLPETLTVKTVNGGRHRYYLYPSGDKTRSTADKLAEGVDVRADGGYAIAPPSPGYEIVDDVAIAELPDEWLNCIRARKNPEDVPRPPQNDPGDAETAREALMSIPSDIGRDEWVEIGMAIHSAGLTYQEFDAWSAKGGDLYTGEADTKKVWDSFNASGGIGVGTLIQHAIKHGYDPTGGPHNTATTTERGKDPTSQEAIKSILWQIVKKKLPAENKHREIAQAVVAWLKKRGTFYFHRERRDFASAMFFDKERKQLLPIQSDCFLAWLSDILYINRSEKMFDFIDSACETEGISDHATGLLPETYWAAREGAYYLSCGPGRMAKVTGQSTTFVDNGTDEILFPYDAALEPWERVKARDPISSCRIFSEASVISETALDVLRVWLVSLIANMDSKPPLCLTSEVGGGKTAIAKAISMLLGVPEKIDKLTDNDRSEKDFWAALDAGGLVCFDNVDSKNKWFPDSLAAASTGGSTTKLKLHTDTTNITLRSRAAVIVTSANPTFASDAGLADRLLVIRMERRTGETADRALFEEVKGNRDAGLSWICETLEATLRDTEPVPGGIIARHPDFAELGIRIGRAIGRETETVAALQAAESDKGLFNIENDWIGQGVLEAVVKSNGFEGTAGDLLEAIKAADPSFEGKLSTKRLAKNLKHLWPHYQTALRAEKKADSHTKTHVYTLHPPGNAVFAVSENVFPDFSYTEEKIYRNPKSRPGTPQTPQTESDPLADTTSDTGLNAHDVCGAPPVDRGDELNPRGTTYVEGEV